MYHTETGNFLYRNDTRQSPWWFIAGNKNSDTALQDGHVEALADLISAAAIDCLIPSDLHVLPPSDVMQSRLLNRFRRGQGERWASALTDQGIANSAIKGLASAHTFWPHEDGRAVSDADILICRDDWSEALAFFQDHGFRIADMPTRSRWGFVSDASFQPLISTEDGSNIDLHIQAAGWPMVRALPAEELLAKANDTNVTGLRAPDRSHAFLIASCHAASDHFGVDGIKSVVDGLLMLRTPETIDFADLRERCRRAYLTKPITVFLALLTQLGSDTTLASAAGFAIDDVDGRAFRQMVRQHLNCFVDATPHTALSRLGYEWSLTTELPVFLRRNGRRIRGLVRPNRGTSGL